MAGSRYRRAHHGGIAWLVDQVTGDLADAITRDLISDRLDFDDLGWRGLWAYVTTAPPGTAIHYARTKDQPTLSDRIAAGQLYEQQKLGWRYTAVHFEGGADAAFPEPIALPGDELESDDDAPTWDGVASIDDLMPINVRNMLKGDA